MGHVVDRKIFEARPGKESLSSTSCPGVKKFDGTMAHVVDRNLFQRQMRTLMVSVHVVDRNLFP
jgi:hypothetical protein